MQAAGIAGIYLYSQVDTLGPEVLYNQPLTYLLAPALQLGGGYCGSTATISLGRY